MFIYITAKILYDPAPHQPGRWQHITLVSTHWSSTPPHRGRHPYHQMLCQYLDTQWCVTSAGGNKLGSTPGLIHGVSPDCPLDIQWLITACLQHGNINIVFFFHSMDVKLLPWSHDESHCVHVIMIVPSLHGDGMIKAWLQRHGDNTLVCSMRPVQLQETTVVTSW